MNIAILQTANYQPQYGKISIQLNKKYCQLNNYSYVFKSFQKNMNFLKCMEQKYNIILENIQKHDYLVFIDLDAVISNPNIKIQNLIDLQHQLFIAQDSGIVGNTIFLMQSAIFLQRTLQQLNVSYIKQFNEFCQSIKKSTNFDLLSKLGTIYCNPNGLNAGFLIIKCTNQMKQFFEHCKIHHELFENIKHDQDCISLMLQLKKYKHLFKMLPENTQGNNALINQPQFYYNEDKSFISHTYGWPDNDKLIAMKKVKNNKFWSKIIKQQKNSFLILQTQTALGDTLVTTGFFKDFHQQYPNKKIYYKVNSNNPYVINQKIEVFKNNPNVKVYQNEDIDQIVEYKCGDYFAKSNIEDISMNHCIYDIFEKTTGLHVQQKTFGADVYLTQNQKNNILQKFNIKQDKPICLICAGYHPIVNSIKYVGTKKIQNIIDALYQKITFIQVGDTGNGYIQNKLNHVVNLINKTSVRDLFALSYNSKYILTGLHSLLHISSNESKNKKYVFVFHGCRENISYYGSFLKLNHTIYNLLGYNPQNFKECLKNNKCCLNDVTFYNRFNQNLNLCKNVINVNNEKIAKCLNDINQNQIIKQIQETL